MLFTETTATKKIIAMNKRIRAVAGGTSGSKTISVLLYLIAKAQSDKELTLTSVVSESMPHLKRGAIKDFLSIMQVHNYYQDSRWNKTDKIYEFETGSKIEFFSADQPSKVRGPRRDRLFVNEGNNIDKESWEQLLIRTKEFAFIDWNPVDEFYMYTDYIGQRDDVEFITLTYKDNEALDINIVKEIESRKTNVQWWQVYGLGQLGEIDTRIYTGWQIIDTIPHEARLEGYGMDFGYTNDPTAIIAVYYYNGGYILDEIAYQKGMSNKTIADVFKNVEKKLIIADSAEPKSIDEIKSYGLSVLPCEKGPGSILRGIQHVQEQKISITKRSVDTIKEYRGYLWQTDKEGRNINQPSELNNHAMDAIRYRLYALKAKPTDYNIGGNTFYRKTASNARW